MLQLSKRLAVFAGLLAAPTATQTSPPPAAVVIPNEPEDPRLQRLLEFLEKHRSPVQHLADEFLTAADEHNLDWRLLPSLSVVESGAGKSMRNNNLFGWDCGRKAFDNVEEGIRTVADRLANSRLYRKKDLDSILRTYNPDADYAPLVKSVMAALGPAAYSGN